MTDPIHDIVLVGGGLAAAKAAETVREKGYDGRLTIVTDELHRPYERPPLTKKVLVGDAEPDSVFVHDRSFYADHDIELVTGDAVTALDRDGGHVSLASGATVAFDRLLLATGAEPRRLQLGEHDLAGIRTMRTLDDSRQLQDDLRAAGHVTVIGAGWIGCEVAAAARALGTDVTLVDPLETPLQRVLGTEVGQVFADLHRDNGVDVRLGTSVSRADGSGRVERVTLEDGTDLPTDLIVVGVGVAPRTDLADVAGLDVDDGVLTDATLVTNDPRIFAAGDVANAWHPHYERHLRVEHWANALNQGKTVGANLLGKGEAYDRLPYFFSDQYDLGLEYVGHANEGDEVVIRGDLETREFIAFWLAAGRVTAAMNVNVWDVVDDLKELITRRVAIDAARLADPDATLVD